VQKRFRKVAVKVLIMGLPNTGKTWLAQRLQDRLKCAWYNADLIRLAANDWDFSEQGRLRQSSRMKALADFESSHKRLVICDFIAPTLTTRVNFDADAVIWMNTAKSSSYKDTDKIFEPPLFVFRQFKQFVTEIEVDKLAAELKVWHESI